MPEMTPERLTEIENWATESLSRGGLGNIDPRVVSGLISEVRRLTAERDAAVAQAQASSEEARALRRAAAALITAADDVLREHGPEAYMWRLSVHAARLDAALATPPTAYAKLAEARTAYIAADRMPGGLPDSQEWRAKFDRLRAAKEALAEAEAAAGEGGANG